MTIFFYFSVTAPEV